VLKYCALHLWPLNKRSTGATGEMREEEEFVLLPPPPPTAPLPQDASRAVSSAILACKRRVLLHLLCHSFNFKNTKQRLQTDRLCGAVGMGVGEGGQGEKATRLPREVEDARSASSGSESSVKW
jgi:hypothetical protein